MIKNKKPVLLYDASILTYLFERNDMRSGIFFMAYNVLKELKRQQIFNIILGINYARRKFIHLMKKEAFFSEFNYIAIYDIRQYIANIKVHKEHIKKKSELVRYIKILKNYLYIFKYNIIDRHKIEKVLKKTNIFFSPRQQYLDVESEICHHIKHFIVLHDLIPLIFHKGTINSYHWFNEIVKSLNKDTYFFCNSKYTKDDFLKYYGSQLDKNKMIVVHHATSQIFYPDYDKKKLVTIFNKYKVQHKDSIKYIFSLCTMEPRKNLKFTVQCFIKFISKHQIQDLFFYLGGSLWDDFIQLLEEQVNNFDEYRDKIIGLGYIDDNDVNILYSNSLFFAYISQYEGFGVPPLEAMQAGTPVITSNNTSLPEVVGDAGIMIDYDNEEQCIKAFEDLYFNDVLREYYIQKGIERARLFSWEKTVDIMSENMLGSLQA